MIWRVLKMWFVVELVAGSATGLVYPWVLLYFPHAPDPMHVENLMRAFGVHQ